MRAIDLLDEVDGASKVIILLTDGSYNAGEVEPRAVPKPKRSMTCAIHSPSKLRLVITMMPRFRRW